MNPWSTILWSNPYTLILPVRGCLWPYFVITKVLIKIQKRIWKVMYPCIFLTTYFWWKQSYYPKNHLSLYFPCIHIEGKKNTRIHNISGSTFFGQIWKVMYPCIFLQNILYGWKIQGYITFQMTGPKFRFWNVTYPCIFLAHI